MFSDIKKDKRRKEHNVNALHKGQLIGYIPERKESSFLDGWVSVPFLALENSWP